MLRKVESEEVMCIAHMVETIVNDWTGEDRDAADAAAARDFPHALWWEITYAVDAENLRDELATGERIMGLRFNTDPHPDVEITLPTAKLRYLTCSRAA